MVVIDEASGTIVMGANVRVSTAAIAPGNVIIRVTETPGVSRLANAGAGNRPDISAHGRLGFAVPVFSQMLQMQNISTETTA